MTTTAPRYNALWSRPGLTLAGTGAVERFDPGTGPTRYERALQFLTDSGRSLAFASFTFDPDERGSVVLIPDGHVEQFEHSPGSTGSGVIEVDDSERWPKMVREALLEIERGSVAKVVLSRRLRAVFESPIDQFEIARRLIESQPGCNVFAVDGLVGASPELLLGVDDTSAISIPLAGSAIDGRPELGTDKNALEHKLAADSVERAFRSVGLEFSRNEPETVEVGDLRHLGTRFEAPIPGGFGFHDILGNLHPTAAVAGTPTKAAVEIIGEMEETSRGRYSGPVGWFDHHGRGEFAVALRCGLVEGSTVLLHSGAGIVEGSTPDGELEETVWKLRPMLDALGLDTSEI